MNKPAIALGGGAVLGTAHIGVLEALEERGIKPEFISGTSIGAFVSSLYAFGLSVEKLKEIALELDWHDITSFKLSKPGLPGNDRIGKLIIEQLKDERTIMIQPKLSAYNKADTRKTKDLIVEGYEEVCRILDERGIKS